MPKWEGAKDGILEEILLNRDTFLPGQLTFATSADQRAAFLGSIFAASAAAIIGGAAWGTFVSAVTIAGLVTASLLLVASGICLLTACPANFSLPGTQPDNRVLERIAMILRWGTVVGFSSPLAGFLAWIFFAIASGR
jgi:hypothetical protein